MKKTVMVAGALFIFSSTFVFAGPQKASEPDMCRAEVRALKTENKKMKRDLQIAQRNVERCRADMETCRSDLRVCRTVETPTPPSSEMNCDATGSWRVISQNCSGRTFLNVAVATTIPPPTSGHPQNFTGVFTGSNLSEGTLDYQVCDLFLCIESTHNACRDHCTGQINSSGRLELNCPDLAGGSCSVIYQKE